MDLDCNLHLLCFFPPEQLTKDTYDESEDVTYSWVREYHWDVCILSLFQIFYAGWHISSFHYAFYEKCTNIIWKGITVFLNYSGFTTGKG